MYVDVYRPVHSKGEATKVPALVGWSPYGKEGGAGNQVLDDFPFRMGVPLSLLTETQKWEGPDPGYWVDFGYAVVNPDPRGIGKSEGDIYHWGTQEGRDGADVIDWIGSQDWCSGKVATTGNSWLAISSWFIAAEQPKHLACISPWEGLSDCFGAGWHGGVLSKANLNFQQNLLCVNAGENSWENTILMGFKYPNWTPYYEDKRAKIENVTVPAYVVASYSNPVHTYGTFNAYCRLNSNKWLRIHDSWEWPDYYNELSRTDLHRFFDHFLKDIDNGWESTPRVRLKILDTANPSALTGTQMQSTAWPLPEAVPTKYFLDPLRGALSTCYPLPSVAQYRASDGGIVFTYNFTDDVVFAGPIQMKLTVSLTGDTDSDIFVTIEKVLASGKVGTQCKIPFEGYQQSLLGLARTVGLAPSVLWYTGPAGRIRVSRRLRDERVSIPGLHVQRYDVSNPITEGELVDVVPLIDPIGMRFSKGEQMRIRMGGQDPVAYPPTDVSPIPPPDVPNTNANVHVTLYGGQCDGSSSYVIFPQIRA